MATSIVNKNVKLIHRKEVQFMTPAPANTGAATFVLTDSTEEDNIAFYMVSNTLHYLYHHDEDGWIQIPSGAFAGTFGAGASGARGRWSSTLTATGGTTSTLTTTALVSGLGIGKKIRFLTGLNAGRESTITEMKVIPSGTSTITFTALASAVANTDTFIIDTGRFFIISAGTLAAGSFRVYDPLLGTFTTLSITGIPATWGTDGRMISTPSGFIHATGTATSATTTTLTNTPKTWTVNQWTNYQIRIVSGTGFGQIRNIVSNTANVITVATWTLTPDATSVYEISGNDDFIYLLGNNAVTMYRYSISGNTWSTLSPGVARTGAPGLGMSANWVGNSGTTEWSNESDNFDGRYIYSFRGGAGTLLDRYDITLNTWLAITYINQAETFTTGTSYALVGRSIFIRKDATGRMFRYSVRSNMLEPFNTTLYPEGAAVLGDKMWGKKYIENGIDKLVWVYWLQNTGNVLHRMLVI